MKLELFYNKSLSSLCFYDSQKKMLTKVKTPVFTAFFLDLESKTIRFNFCFNLKISYFNNFLFWLASQNLILKNNLSNGLNLSKNKIFILKLLNNFHILFWKYQINNLVIFIEDDKVFSDLFAQNYAVFKEQIYKNSKLFICSTDTVVGLGSFYHDLDLDAIYKIKNRDVSKKIVTLVGKISQIKPLISPSNYKILKQKSKKYWPGAVTFIIEKKSFRIPGLKKYQDLFIKNGPAFVTSANISGQKPLNFNGARQLFWQITKFYDFGHGSGQPSKIYDIDLKTWVRI
ncbi:Sua5/YciO/YrdC/YwlC family protein [Mesomycoplasma ovipneumoniae]|uniref:Sua5/YciO/YrdC/YwlC family protein n=1 Tax=Mesomycoplasma ovipneumoniae TaxID=29562 RepID=UPI002965698D|nr:Sua5/YciO/YrdC/YwlC family protein [Mesomycoplasma ovipneumoniae]MDW2860937.1 Sua5/YciO/YrdC/YwlC family protein [Mesomycoplasma ovipneumoniae]